MFIRNCNIVLCQTGRSLIQLDVSYARLLKKTSVVTNNFYLRGKCTFRYSSFPELCDNTYENIMRNNIAVCCFHVFVTHCIFFLLQRQKKNLLAQTSTFNKTATFLHLAFLNGCTCLQTFRCEGCLCIALNKIMRNNSLLVI